MQLGLHKALQANPFRSFFYINNEQDNTCRIFLTRPTD